MSKILDRNSAKEIISAINSRIDFVANEVFRNSPYNKTKFGRVISSNAGVFNLEIDKREYPGITALRNVGEIKNGENVVVSIPNNNMSDAIIIGVADGTLKSSGGGGTGTVSSIDIEGISGISASGGPITSSGTITVAHTNSVIANTTQAIYPITIDEQGHISSYGAAKTIPDVIDNLTSVDAVNALSANQGRILKNLIPQTLNNKQLVPNGNTIIYGTDIALAIDNIGTLTDAIISANIRIDNNATSLLNKLEASNIKAGSNITLSTSGNDVTISASTGSGGTNVFVNDVRQDSVSFTSDPQTQIDAKSNLTGNNIFNGNQSINGTLSISESASIAGRNIPTKISFSRFMRWEQTNTAQSGTQTCSFTNIYEGTAGNLADNEFISSVTLASLGGAYSNLALAFVTGLEISSTQIKVSWYRNNNDNNNLLRIFALVCKYE